MTKTNIDKVDLRTSVHLLHRAGQCADDLFSSTIDDMQLTPRQYTVLHCASVAEGASQTDLVETTGIDRSTLADIVRRLVERGLLARERTQRDARMYSVQVTDVGRKVLEKARPVMEASENRLLDAVGPADREAFVRALRNIIHTFGPISSARVSARHPRPEPQAAEARRQNETAGL